MKYRCTLCGYIYDNEKEEIAFNDLPEDWLCPLCGAPKSEFELVEEEKKTKLIEKQIENNYQKLTIGELSALFSNLARGCEKQYLDKEKEVFLRLSKYFEDKTPNESNKIEDLINLLNEDINNNYQKAINISQEKSDRGAQRVCSWGEKATKIINSLLSRYEAEGEKLFEENEIWLCTICGFIFIGKTAPALCPICKVQSDKFIKVDGRVKLS